jgi:hypothetical protein
MRVEPEAVQQSVAAARTVVQTQDAISRRYHHPAIDPPERKCYRVIRRYSLNGELQFEDIGAFNSLGNALSMSTRELGYAVILDPNNKQVSYNGQPLEERTA